MEVNEKKICKTHKIKNVLNFHFFYAEGGRGVPNQLRGDTTQVQKQLRRPENVIIKQPPKRNLRQVQKTKSIQVMRVT